MLCRRFEFEYLDVKYDIVLDSKFTILQGDSATGKRTVLEAIRYYKSREDSKYSKLFEKCNIPEFVNNKLSKQYLRESCDENTVLLFDEDTISRIYNVKVFEQLNHLKCYCIIIYRPPVMHIHVSYKDYKKMVSIDGVNKLVPLYHNFDTFVPADRYVIEDEKSAYLYFKTRLLNLESSKGKEKLYEVSADLNDVTIIADGAAISAEFPELFLQGHKMFLPDSFEALIIKYFRPDVYDSKFEDCPVSEQNYERYFEHIINTLGLPFYYRKGTLSYEVFSVNLVEDLSDVVSEPEYLEVGSLLKQRRRDLLLERRVYQNISKAVKDTQLKSILFNALEDNLDINNFDVSYKDIMSETVKKYYKEHYIK